MTLGLDVESVVATAGEFDIDSPNRSAEGAEFAGLGARWKIAPLRMARAYLELVHKRREAAVQPIVEGMARSARIGTGAEVDRALGSPIALAKTGTAACVHQPHLPGDGFAIALVPADDPKILLMVRVHGVPGSQAARTAGQMLHAIEK
jgi:hypothetical protein